MFTKDNTEYFSHLVTAFICALEQEKERAIMPLAKRLPKGGQLRYPTMEARAFFQESEKANKAGGRGEIDFPLVLHS